MGNGQAENQQRRVQYMHTQSQQRKPAAVPTRPAARKQLIPIAVLNSMVKRTPAKSGSKTKPDDDDEWTWEEVFEEKVVGRPGEIVILPDVADSPDPNRVPAPASALPQVQASDKSRPRGKSVLPSPPPVPRPKPPQQQPARIQIPRPPAQDHLVTKGPQSKREKKHYYLPDLSVPTILATAAAAALEPSQDMYSYAAPTMKRATRENYHFPSESTVPSRLCDSALSAGTGQSDLSAGQHAELVRLDFPMPPREAIRKIVHKSGIEYRAAPARIVAEPPPPANPLSCYLQTINRQASEERRPGKHHSSFIVAPGACPKEGHKMSSAYAPFALKKLGAINAGRSRALSEMKAGGVKQNATSVGPGETASKNLVCDYYCYR